MRSTHCVIVSAFLLVGVDCLIARQAADRTMRRMKEPIEQRLLPGDKRVVIDLNPFPPLLVQFDGNASEGLTDRSDVSFFGTVIDNQGHLTPDRSSIYSIVSVRVERPLKSPPQESLKPGDVIRFRQEGGVVQVGGVVVEGVLSWARKPFQVGVQYLIFAMINPEGEFITGPSAAYELTTVFGLPRFQRLMSTHDQPNDIEELLSSEVLTRIEDRLRARNAPF